MRNRAGIALVLALTVLLVVEALTACMLTLATQARLVGASDIRSARADAAAQLAVGRVLNAATQDRYDTLPAGVIVPLITDAEADASWSATIERLQSGLFVIRANAQVGGGSAFSQARAVAIAHVLDRTAVLRESNSAVIGSGLTIMAGAAQITADPAGLPPTWPASICPAVPPLPMPDAMTTASPPTISATAAVTGSILVDTMLAIPDSLALGGLSWSELASVADRAESGIISPAAVHDATSCDQAAAGNWGDPFQPGSPCADYFPLIVSRGDLQVQGGAGQGILAVAGTLTLSAGASFVGVIIARDGVSIEPGAAVHGSVRSRGPAALIDDATIAYSRCAIARALAQTPAGRRLMLKPRTFIPAF
ncbi:MAG TPA: hypothetical protein VF021_07015 [Longimicrobiales bacterium]